MLAAVLTPYRWLLWLGGLFVLSAYRFPTGVVGQLPTSTLTAFVVEGGPNGVVRYSVVVASEQGGQLVVEVSGTGQVLSVDPV